MKYLAQLCSRIFTFWKISVKGFAPVGQLFYLFFYLLPESGYFCHFGAVFPPLCTDWREILLGQADPHAPRLCQISLE